ncbi:MAG: hypothetical protein LBG95_04480 [Treponema sp.]|jgi:hypothetical protein|nr:hypothetical protein [Treponema sp.]
MKKLIVFLAVFALLAGVAFAQITLGGWGNGIFAPIMVEGAPQAYGVTLKDAAGKDLKSTVYAGTGGGWGDSKIAADVYVSGSTDEIGFGTGFNKDGTFQGSIWAKPFNGSDMFKLTVGNFEDNTLRGKITTDKIFEDFTIGMWQGLGEAGIFSNFHSPMNDNGGNKNGSVPQGFMLSSIPMEGLFIGILVNGSLGSGEWIGDWQGNPNPVPIEEGGETGVFAFDTLAKSMLRNMQIGFGYDIAGIGHFRAQWIGGYAGTEKLKEDDHEPWVGGPGRIEVAFALTAVENLLVDIGGKIWMPITNDNDKPPKSSNGAAVGLGASYRAGDFGITARVQAGGLGAYDRKNPDDKMTKGMEMGIILIPTFNVGFGDIGLSLGFKARNLGIKDAKGDAVEDQVQNKLGFGVFVDKGLNGWGNGHIKAGLAYSLPWLVTGVPPGSNEKKTGATGSAVFSIPVIIEYWW